MQTRRRNTTKKSETSFLEKLYNILKEDKYSKYIHWSPDGLYIIISDSNGLTKNVLPEFYKHHNFSSFVRQLNMYNFRKVKPSKKGEQKYGHNEFIEAKSLKEIKLITKKKNPEPVANNDLTNFKNFNISKEDKEYMHKIEEIENLDEESKIKEYKTILKNEELTNLVNEKILNWLINKSRENNDSKRLIENEINNLANQNNNLMKQLELLKNKLKAQNEVSKKMKGMIMFLSLLKTKKILNAINLDLDNINDFEKKITSYKIKIENEFENPFDLIPSDTEEEIEEEGEEEEDDTNKNPNPNQIKFSAVPPPYIFNPNIYSGVSYISNNNISIESDCNYDRRPNLINYDNINGIEGYNNNELLKMKQLINNSFFLTNSNNFNNNINNSIRIQDSIFFLKNQNIPNLLKHGYLYKKCNSHQYEKRSIIIDSTPKLIIIDPEKNIREDEILLENSLKVVHINKKEFELVAKDKIYKFKDIEENANNWERAINNAINICSK